MKTKELLKNLKEKNLKTFKNFGLFTFVIIILLTLIFVLRERIDFKPKIVLGQSYYAGININPSDPCCTPSSAHISHLGAGWVRLVYRSNVNYDALVNSLNSAGIRVLMILNQETHPTMWTSGPTISDEFIENFSQRAGEIAAHFGNRVAAYEIWNEEDARSPASIYLYPQDYARLLRRTYQSIKAVSNANVIVGGLLGGVETGYLDAVNSAGGLYDAVGVHPYILDIEGVANSIDGYRAHSQGKPVWVTEFGWESSNQEDQANYLANVCVALRGKAANVMWFSWADQTWHCGGGGQCGFGLNFCDCTPKLAYSAFQEYCASIPASPPPPLPPATPFPYNPPSGLPPPGSPLFSPSEQTFDWPPDPAHFYVPKEGNKDIISMVKSLLSRLPAIGPSPDPDWTPDQPGEYEGPMPNQERIEEMLPYARFASEHTGVRASLILALLFYESGYEQFLGSGHYPFDLCEHPACEEIGEINCSNFEIIWNREGYRYPQYNIHTVPLSSAGTYCAAGECLDHCGGAMGPAQAMSYSWRSLESLVQAITGSADPWNYWDAFLFAGFHLKYRGGADSQRCADEAEAVYRYVGGHRNHAYRVVALANEIALQTEENLCHQ